MILPFSDGYLLILLRLQETGNSFFSYRSHVRRAKEIELLKAFGPAHLSQSIAPMCPKNPSMDSFLR